MAHSLYLNPPSVGELYWAALCVSETPEQAFEEVKGLSSPLHLWYYIHRTWEVPSDIPKEVDNLEQFMRGIKSVKQKKAQDLHGFRWPGHSYYGLSPSKTIKNHEGNCKSLAILYVALSRAKGQPARFYAVTDDHVIVEKEVKLNEDSRVWKMYDPTFVIPSWHDINHRPDYDIYYERVLEFLNSRSVRSLDKIVWRIQSAYYRLAKHLHSY